MPGSSKPKGRRVRKVRGPQGVRDASGGQESPPGMLPYAGRLLVSQGWRVGLLIAVLYVAVMAVLSFKYHVIGDYGVETDFYNFVFEARQLLYGNFETDGARGPVYFIVLALAGEIVGDYFSAGMVIGLISAGLAIYFTYLVLRHLCGEEIAFFATLLSACNPVFVQFTYSSGTDMIFVALATMTIYFYLAAERLAYHRVVLTGILCALAYLTRYNGVFLAVGVMLALLFLNIWGLSRRERLMRCAVFGVVFVVVTIPWGLFLKHQTGDFFYNPNYKNVAFLVYGEGSIDWDEFIRKQGEEFHSFADVVSRDPGLFVSRMFRSLYRHIAGDMGKLMGWHIGVLAIPGLALILSRRRSKKQLAYVLFNVLAFGTLVTVAYNPRFSMFLIPFYVFLALGTLAFVGRHVRYHLRAVVRLVPAVFAILIALTVTDTIRFNREKINEGPKHVLTTAEWFRERVPEEMRKGIIVARKPHIAYYLDLEFKWIPDVKTHADLREALNAMDADYLYFSNIEAHWRPELASLMNPEKDHPGLLPLMFIGKPPVSVLYKVMNE